MLITNYIRSAWRNILRHKLFSIINILGLAIGLAAVVLIALYVRYESSYDSFWKNSENVYRLHMTRTILGQTPTNFLVTSAPVIKALKQNFPEISDYTRVTMRTQTVTIGNDTFHDDISIVDKGIVNIFDFNEISGDIQSALNDTDGLILNETLALKYFGRVDVIGETLNIDFSYFKRDYVVNAVIKDIPDNSKLVIQAMVPIVESDYAKDSFMNNWYGTIGHSYFTVNATSDIKQIENMLTEFVDRSFPPPPYGDSDLKPSQVISLSAMNLQDLHLNAKGYGVFSPQGNRNTVTVFALVAILILFIAIVNYINLSTARATVRAREVGIRKVHGAKRKQLIYQFIGESVLFASVSVLIALAITEATLPLYNEFMSAKFVLNYKFADIFIFVLLALAVGLIGGIYPAFVLSKFRPTVTLKPSKSSECNIQINSSHIAVYCLRSSICVNSSHLHANVLCQQYRPRIH